ncbi:MAG: hypothetical protein R2844_01090 [Caldilineales bacterium]
MNCISWLVVWRWNNASASTPIKPTVNKVTATKLATRRQRIVLNMGRKK